MEADMRAKCFFPIAFVGASLLVFTGCTNIAEFDSLVEGTLTVYTEDFAVVGQIQGIEEARQILVYPGYVFVLKGTGYIDKYSSDNLEFLGSYKIGQPSPAGYSRLAYSPNEQTVYVIGPQANIIEISIPECLVVDEFIVCSAPSILSASSTSPAYLYVGDGASSTVWAVRGSSNIPVDSWVFPAGLICIEASEIDTTLVSTEVGVFAMEFLVSGGLRAHQVITSDCVSMEHFPWYGNFAAVTPGGGISPPRIRTIEIEFDPELMEDAFFFSAGKSLQGSNHILGCDSDRYAYVVSYLGGGVSRLVRFDMAFQDIDNEFDLSGVALDMDVSGSGLIYLLTMEGGQ